MKPERWQQVREVLHEAMQMDEQERSAFLDIQCATDPSLRAELNELLVAERELGSSFLESPALVHAAVHTDSSATVTVLTAGTTIGPYVVQSLIGAGGLGEVYRAHDPRLGRDVAIKVLPNIFASDPDRLSRFEQEARAAAAEVPNIMANFERMGAAAGEKIHYVVSELLEGETLRACLSRGPSPVGQTVDLVSQLASGLAAAHKKGIIHRDLKPENLFLTAEGRLKILDFGLAKLTRARGSSPFDVPTLAHETGAGVVLGTVGYMSPEQVRGIAVDHRADIFAVGAILYEMLSGQRAFQKPTAAEIMTAILNENPPATSKIGPGVPPAFLRVVDRCLEKSPERRFQSAQDLAVALEAVSDPGRFIASLSDESAIEEVPASTIEPAPQVARRKFPRQLVAACLVLGVIATALIVGLNWDRLRRRWLPAAGAHRIESLAVLPLHNLSPDREQEYFSDGMTDQLITDLAKFGGLRVISHTSVERYKGTQRSLPDIARELGVDAVVEGTVTRSGDRVRITAQLIDARTDAHLWAETYQRDVRDVLSLQDELSRDIAEEVRIKVTPEERSRVTAARTVNPQAYDAYLRGRHLWLQRNPGAIASAIDYFQQAVREDPSFALAYSGLADCYWVGWGTKVDIPLAEQYARKAIALQPELAEGHVSLGVALGYRHEMAEAGQELRRAIELNPNYAMAHHLYADYLRSVGRLADAIVESDRTKQLHPLYIALNKMPTLILKNSQHNDLTLDKNRR
jgi:serine/threonine protein kinase